MTRKGLGIFLFVGTLVAAGGCERTVPTVPVEGTVTRNGKPQTDLEVVFLADPDTRTVGPRATGRTDESGRYRLQIDGGGQGTHRVLVLDLRTGKQAIGRGKGAVPTPPEHAKRGEDELRAPRVPANYGSINNTPLRATVGTEPLVFDIEIR